jgi:hypothetical protein
MPLIFGAALLLIGSVFLSAPQAHAAGFSCVHLAHTLSLGSRDANTQNEVSLLQRFLAQDQTLYPEGQITGYFGPLTQRAVQRFQARAGIVNYGTPYTTGYGSVGVRTRAAIMQYCTNTPVYSDGMTVKDIDRIFAYINRETKTTDVDVIINNAPDISLSFDETAKSRITRALGEALEADHDFDFSEFSSDRSRDSRLSRLTDWTYEGADEDTDMLTIDDIRKIMVTEGDDYADVTVDLREADDLTFDIVEESQSKMVSAVAEKLENSFDMDFSEFSSDSKRDAQIKRLILWEDATSDTSYTLDDVAKVTLQSVDPIPEAIDDEYSLYTITLDSGRIIAVKACGFCTTDMRNKAFTDTGYTGDVAALMAMAVSVTSSGSYSLTDVKSVVVSTPTDTQISDPSSTYTITLYDGRVFTVSVSGLMTSDTYTKAFRDTGYTGDVAKLTALATQPSSASGSYALPVSIVGEMYGGCRLGCPAFSLAQNGEYTYYRYGRSDSTHIKNGTVSSELIKKLQNGFDATTLASNAKTAAHTQCSSYVDGTDITYTVTRDGKTYELDTCTTAFANSSSFQSVFSSIWTELFAK